jgi:hypothetical protein
VEHDVLDCGGVLYELVFEVMKCLPQIVAGKGGGREKVRSSERAVLCLPYLLSLMVRSLRRQLRAIRMELR